MTDRPPNTMTRSEPFAAVLLAALLVAALATGWIRASREDAVLSDVAECADREGGPAGDVGAAVWRDAWDRCWERRTP